MLPVLLFYNLFLLAQCPHAGDELYKTGSRQCSLSFVITFSTGARTGNLWFQNENATNCFGGEVPACDTTF
jgi:hypothetical protein